MNGRKFLLKNYIDIRLRAFFNMSKNFKTQQNYSHKKTKKLECQETSYDQFFLDYIDS